MSGYFQNFPWLPYWWTEADQPFAMLHVLKRFKINEVFKKYVQSWDYYRISDGETPESVSLKIYNDNSFYWVLILFNNLINPLEDWPKTEEKLKEYVMAKYSPNRNQTLISTTETVVNTTTVTVLSTAPILLEAGMQINCKYADDNTLIKLIVSETNNTVDNVTIYTTIFSLTKPILQDGTYKIYYTTPFGGANDHAIHHYEDLTDGEWIVPTEEQKTTLSSVSNYDYEYALNEQKRMIRIPSKVAVMKVVRESETILLEVE